MANSWMAGTFCGATLRIRCVSGARRRGSKRDSIQRALIRVCSRRSGLWWICIALSLEHSVASVGVSSMVYRSTFPYAAPP